MTERYHVDLRRLQWHCCGLNMTWIGNSHYTVWKGKVSWHPSIDNTFVKRETQLGLSQLWLRNDIMAHMDDMTLEMYFNPDSGCCARILGPLDKCLLLKLSMEE